MVNRRRFIAAAAVLPLSACKIKTINYFPTTPATVRYVNLMPAAGAFDIYNGGEAAHQHEQRAIRRAAVHARDLWVVR